MNARPAGVLLVAAFAVFLVGAGFWIVGEFERPLPERLRAAEARSRRWIWIHSWMAAGTVLGMAAAWCLAARLADQGAGALASVAAGLFTAGCAVWMVTLAIHLVSTLPAARRLVQTGEVPTAYVPRHLLASRVHVAFMLASYTAWALFGAAILQSAVPHWAGWFGVLAGPACAIGFLATRGGPFSPPIIAHAYGLLIGILLLVG